MCRRYTHCVYHNLALGRGPLKAIVHRDADDASLRCCRHGCGVEETLEHILCHCSFVAGQREGLKCVLAKDGLSFSVQTALSTFGASGACEKLIAKFLMILNE